MGRKTGRIYTPEAGTTLITRLRLAGEGHGHIKSMAVDPTPVQARKGRVGRNDRCPCGSGKKFKRCCKVRS